MPLLKRYDAPARPMCQWGSHALKSLNDNKDPGIDLLVREAVQNSADASLGRKYVDIDFYYRPFDCSRLNRILDEPTLKRLKSLNCGSLKGTSLEIRDTKTKGLDGPARLSDVPRLKPGQISQQEMGNFIKLTQCIGQAQTKEGAGGSFGVGKTVFYRVGMAPVMFYSRFQGVNGKFRERLIFCFFEDQTEDFRSQSLLLNETGFAWWCEDVTKQDEALPTEEKGKITRILSQVGVQQFTGSETGTAIFIPMLRIGGLPASSASSSCDARSPEWLSSKDSVERHAEYTRVALQRWYAPRLANDEYRDGPILRVRVNDRPVKNSLPLFVLMRDLYNVANSGDVGSVGDAAKVLTYRINTTFKNPSESPAKIAVLRLPKDDKLLTGEDGFAPSPEIQISNYEREEQSNGPILALVRKPGMIVSYIREGAWVRGIPEDRNHYIVGILVLNGSAIMRDEFAESHAAPTNLEEYVRRNEPAAHNSWSEEKNIGDFQPDVFGAMQRGASAAIKREFFSEEPTAGHSSKLSAVAARIAGLLLPQGFGSAARRFGGIKGGNKGKGAGKGKAGLSMSFEIFEPRYLKDGLSFDFVVTTGVASSKKSAKQEKTFSLLLCAATESGRITAETWRKETGQAFPFELRRLTIASSEGKGRKSELGIKLNKCGTASKRTLTVSMHKESIQFTTSKLGEAIAGTLDLRVTDDAFMPAIILSDVSA